MSALQPPSSAAHELRRALGRYWSSVFEQPGLVRALCSATGEVRDRIMDTLTRCADEANRGRTTTIMRRAWRPVTLTPGDGHGPALLWRVLADDPVVCGVPLGRQGAASEVPKVGGRMEHPDTTDYAVALGDCTLGMLTDNPFVAGRTYVPGVDFKYVPGGIAFFGGADPFAALARPGDRSVVVFAVDVAERNSLGLADVDFMRVGGAPTAELLNGLADLRLFGGTVSGVLRVAGAILGVPVAEADEVVEEVRTDAIGQVVITDKQVYRIPSDQTLRGDITAGAALSPGHPLTSALALFCPLAHGGGMVDVHGTQDMRSALPALYVPSALCGGGGGLVFPWGVSALTSVVNAAGVRAYRFPVSGTADAVAAWWAWVDQVAAEHGWYGLFAGADDGTAAGVEPAAFALRHLYRGRGAWLVARGVKGSAIAWRELLASTDPRVCMQLTFLADDGTAEREDGEKDEYAASFIGNSMVERGGHGVVGTHRQRGRETYGHHYVARTA